MYHIDPERLDLVEEFRARPLGPHSPELKRLANRLRMGPLGERYVLICRKPHREWVLGRLTGRRGDRIQVFADQVFHSQADGEWEVFRRRWETQVGRKLPANRDRGEG